MNLYNLNDSKMLLTFLCDTALLQEKEIKEMQKKRLYDQRIIKSGKVLLANISGIEGFAQPLIEELKSALRSLDVNRICRLNDLIYVYVVAWRKSSM